MTKHARVGAPPEVSDIDNPFASRRMAMPIGIDPTTGAIDNARLQDRYLELLANHGPGLWDTIEGAELRTRLTGLRIVPSARDIDPLAQGACAGADQIVLASPTMIAMYWDLCDQLAVGRKRFLVVGERGTGKGVVATLIAALIGKKIHAFNCAGYVDTLVDSQLFGIAPNSGIANVSKGGLRGQVEAADGNVLFLDEFFDAPSIVFPKLLRVVQEGRYSPLGDTEERTLAKDTIIVAASNRYPTRRDLHAAVAARVVRADLVDRFSSVLEMVPLRDRREEIPEIAATILRRYESPIEGPATSKHGRLSAQTRVVLSTFEYGWPGNIRELEVFVETQARLRRQRPSVDGLDISDEVMRGWLRSRAADVESTVALVEHGLSTWEKDWWTKAKRDQMLQRLSEAMRMENRTSVDESWVSREVRRLLPKGNLHQLLKTHAKMTCADFAKMLSKKQ